MTVALGGSRHLQEEALVRHILGHIQQRGWSVATGCAPGIDAVVRRVAVELGAPLTVYAVGAREGDDWGGKFGTRAELRGLEAAGTARIVWSAGGTEGTISQRLHRRTVAMVNAPDIGWVVMITAPDSKGSKLALMAADDARKRWTEYKRGEG